MLYFLSKTVLHGRQRVTATSPAHPFHQLFHTLYLRNNPLVISLSTRFISSTSTSHSFTVSYLIGKCGFSPASALAVSQRFQFGAPDKPDSIVAFFKNQGFSHTQIKRIIKGRPDLLLYNAEKSLLPKFEFFESRGFSKRDVISICYVYPEILVRSTERRIIPSFDAYINLLQSEKKGVEAIKRKPRILFAICSPFFLPNVNVLRENGVSDRNILTLVHSLQWTLVINTLRLKTIVEKVKKMEFKPSTRLFVLAVHAMLSMNECTWGKKISALKEWGLSDEEILKAFRGFPWFMTKSVDKIMAVMGFLVNKMGLQPSSIVKYPSIISFSLEKRIIPRSLFVQDLLSRGLVKELHMQKVYYSSEESFLQIFVNCHEEKVAAELLELYKAKIDLSMKQLKG